MIIMYVILSFLRVKQIDNPELPLEPRQCAGLSSFQPNPPDEGYRDAQDAREEP